MLVTADGREGHAQQTPACCDAGRAVVLLMEHMRWSALSQVEAWPCAAACCWSNALSFAACWKHSCRAQGCWPAPWRRWCNTVLTEGHRPGAVKLQDYYAWISSCSAAGTDLAGAEWAEQRPEGIDEPPTVTRLLQLVGLEDPKRAHASLVAIRGTANAGRTPDRYRDGNAGEASHPGAGAVIGRTLLVPGCLTTVSPMPSRHVMLSTSRLLQPPSPGASPQPPADSASTTMGASLQTCGLVERLWHCEAVAGLANAAWQLVADTACTPVLHAADDLDPAAVAVWGRGQGLPAWLPFWKLVNRAPALVSYKTA
eukprot:365126-Chlamydomonas_euryale.AAC.63